MRICIIWKNDYPWDVRIEKFAMALKEAGHDISILCSNIKMLKREDSLDGIKIYRLPCSNNVKINSLISSPFYLNPFWLAMCCRVIKHNNIDLIIVRDIPLILIGLLMKRKYRVPVILDMAENYPAMYWKRIEKGGWSAAKNWFIKNPYVIDYVEKYAIKNVDYLSVVVEESADRLIERGADRTKISIISNTPDLTKFAADSRVGPKKYLQLIYVGFVQEGRGLDIAIKSLVTLKRKRLPVKLVIIGTGDYLEQLKSLAKELEVHEIVDFKGWIDNSIIPCYIAESDVGVIPHKKTAHTDTTIPNKLFDFMAGGKPVLVSDANPMKRIVTEEECGLVFRSGDHADLSRAIERILDAGLLARLGKNGKMAVKRRYNWHKDSIILKEAVAKFQM